MKTFEVEVRVRNNLLRERRRMLGLTIKEMAEATGCPYSTLCGYETMRENPYKKNGSLKVSAQKVCDYLYVEPQDLWPDEVLDVVEPVKTVKIDVGYQSLIESRPYMLPDANLSEKELEVSIHDALSTLTRREQKVIRARFGIDEKEKTLGEAAEALHISSNERVRQIEAQALRKLRHPTRSEKLIEHYEEDH